MTDIKLQREKEKEKKNSNMFEEELLFYLIT